MLRVTVRSGMGTAVMLKVALPPAAVRTSFCAAACCRGWVGMPLPQAKVKGSWLGDCVNTSSLSGASLPAVSLYCLSLKLLMAPPFSETTAVYRAVSTEMSLPVRGVSAVCDSGMAAAGWAGAAGVAAPGAFSGADSAEGEVDGGTSWGAGMKKYWYPSRIIRERMTAVKARLVSIMVSFVRLID